MEIREDIRFLCTPTEFIQWAGNRKQLMMEFFYREMRKKYNILMNSDSTEGDKWNFDSENRKPPIKNLIIPANYKSEPDQITDEVIKLVNENCDNHCGDIEPFFFAVTRD